MPNPLDRAILRDGSLRLRAGGCTFLFTRLKPGVLLTTVAGLDQGQLGTAPLDEVAAEYRRFGQPVEWFVDAREGVNAAGNVSTAWVSWLQENRALIRRMGVYVGSKPLHLTITIATHLSRAGELMQLYSDRGELAKAVAASVPGLREWPPVEELLEAPAALSREGLPGGGVRLVSGERSFTLRRLRPGVVFGVINGYDEGQFGAAPFDELEAELERSPGPLSLFMDAQEGTGATLKVSSEWTAWFAAHRTRLKQVGLLVRSRPLELTANMARQFAGTGELFRVYTDAEEFQAAVAREAPEFRLAEAAEGA